MLDKIADIRKALECDCYQSALACALTLPDICGIIKYPDETKVWKRYSEWFDEYVYPFYEHKKACKKYSKVFEFKGNYC